MGKLTAKQQCFVDEYMIDLNATAAAKRAGYSEKTAGRIGQENLQKPVIVEAIEAAKAERSKRTEIDADWVLKQAAKLHQRCMQEIKPVMVRDGKEWVQATGEDDEGNEGLLFTFNANGAAKALEIVGKHVGVQAFQENVKHTHEGEVTHNHTERMSRLNALKAQAANKNASQPTKH